MMVKGGAMGPVEIYESQVQIPTLGVKSTRELPALTLQPEILSLQSEKIRPDVESETAVLSDEEILDSIPLHELNYNVPMPYLSIDTEDLGDDEFRNDGTRYLQFLKNQANFYRSLLPLGLKEYDPDEGAAALPPVNQCKGVLFESGANSFMFDRATPRVVNEFDFYEAVCSSLDTYEGLIYLFTDTDIYQVSPETFLNEYKGMFDTFEEKTNS